MARKPFFSGNYGSALSSNANAANLIARAGATQGQMFANLGGQIGGMIQQYGLNKEKQGKLTDKIENRLKLDPSIAQRLTMSGDEEFDKKNATDMEKLTSGELGLKGLQRLDSAMATINEVDLLKQAEEDREMKKSAFQLSQLTQQLMNENRRLTNKYEAGTLGARVGEQEARTSIAQTEADYAGDQQSSTLAARGASTDAIRQRTKQSKESFPLEMENLRSQIRSRNIFSGKALMDAVGIQGNAPADLEKRFSETATQLNKIDDSRIKVKTSGLFGGEEKEITFKEFNENPDNYAPVTSDRIKALQASKDRLIQEQTEGMFDVKIPAFDPETGESILITLRQKMEYDEARRKKREEEERALQQANQINVRSQLQGVRN